MLSNPGSAIQYACYPKHPQNWQRTKPKRKLCDILLDLPQRWHELSTSTQGHLSTSYKSSWLPYLLLWNPRKSLDSKFLLDISPPKLVYFPRLDKHMLATSYWNFIFAIPTDCSKIWPRIWQGINKKLTDLPFPWSPSCHTEELNQDSICNFTTLTSSQTLEWFCGHSCSLSQDPKTWPVRIWQPALKKSNSVWSGSHISQPLPSLLVKSVLPSQRWRQDKSTLPPRTFHHLLQAGISPCLSCVFLLFLWLKKKKSLYVIQLTQACCLSTQSSAHCTNHLPSQLLLKAQRQGGDQPGRNKTGLLSYLRWFTLSSRGAWREDEDLVLEGVSWAPAEAGKQQTQCLC